MIGVVVIALAAHVRVATNLGSSRATPLAARPLVASPRALVRAASSSDEEGYGPVGSLLRHGPVPFFQRITDPDKYEKSVQNYQAKAKCSRMEAQGNMDFYLADPNSWTFNELEAKRTGRKPNYSSLPVKQIVLTVTWGVAIIYILGKAASGLPAYMDAHQAFLDAQ